MELDALIGEICTRVQQRMQELEGGADGDKEAPKTCGASQDPAAAAEDKPGLLILTQEHGTLCHPALESSELKECYRTDCALLMEYQCDVEQYEGVIAYTLTNEALGKLANGIFDDDYTRAFGKALLLGKQIFVPEEEVELYRYRGTAPAGYFGRLEENLKFLEKNGVRIVPAADLVQTVLDGGCEKACCKEAEQKKEEKLLRLDKKVVTERDLISAKEEKATCVLVGRKAILTDLAKDYAKRHGIELKREDACASGKGA